MQSGGKRRVALRRLARVLERAIVAAIAMRLRLRRDDALSCEEERASHLAEEQVQREAWRRHETGASERVSSRATSADPRKPGKPVTKRMGGVGVEAERVEDGG